MNVDALFNVNALFDWAVLEIIWIDIVLSGDNAILIALACRELPEKQRKWGVLLGAMGGVLLRIAFTFIIIQLMAIPLLKTIGALLLLGVAIKLLIDETDHSGVPAKPNLWGAVVSIIIADAVMSLDNVIAIAAAARGAMPLIIFGLALSVPIVMFGASLLLRLMDRFPLLVWLGAALLGWVAGDMAANDPMWTQAGDADHRILEIVLPSLGVAIVAVSAWVWKRFNRTSSD
jgi:YjbE family integral membrane protein